MYGFYNRGLEEEARRLREEGEARSRRREAKVVRADWKTKSIAKKPQGTIDESGSGSADASIPRASKAAAFF